MTTRNLLFGSFAAIAFANGVSEHVARSISDTGAMMAAFDSFGVSMFVWIALTIAIWLIVQAPERQADRRDAAVAGGVAICCLIPIPALAWLGLAGIGIHLIRSSSVDDPMRRAGVVLAAIVVPMLWVRLLLVVFGNFILKVDAKIVSLIVGTTSVGNTVPFADGSGAMFIEPACSSLTNLSLTFLCGVLFVSVYRLSWNSSVISTIALACGATMIVNVARISAIGVLPGLYDQIHGPVGAFAAQCATMLIVLMIYAGRLKSNA